MKKFYCQAWDVIQHSSWLGTQGWGSKDEKYGQTSEARSLWTISIPCRTFGPVQKVLDIWSNTKPFGMDQKCSQTFWLERWTKFQGPFCMDQMFYEPFGWDQISRSLCMDQMPYGPIEQDQLCANHLHPVIRTQSL